MQFHAVLSQHATATEEVLSQLMPPEGTRLADAMRYAVLSGGKRIRAFFVMETALMFGAVKAPAARVAAAVECLHGYSLVHDDLPAMDDDDLRRGKPTVHKAFDEATAILAGDALQALAFDILAGQQTAIDANVRVKLIGHLAKASGAWGMVAGQAMDIEAETSKTPYTLDQITQLQRLKTGALIRWSVEAGAILGKFNAEPLMGYADAIGLAFQIRDDVLDVEGSAAATGKATGKDAVAGKATFVSLLGLEGAKKRAAELVEEACDAIAPYGSAARNLHLAARFVISRDN
ncbi:polyprenyl synthetase family protein [Halovulum sp. GXIMD14793]